MDAQAYLIRHGWSGPGNPLNPNQRPGPHGGLGLTKPILVARKQNNHGVGKKTTKDPTNQWWLRGFEDALKGVGDDSPAAVSAKTNNALTSELYRFFVRGEALAGTLEKKVDAMVEKTREKSKRKRDAEEEEEEEEEEEDRKARKEERAARKEENRKRRKVKEIEGVDSAGSSELVEQRESKEERRLRRKEKKREKESRKSVVSLLEGESKDLKKLKRLKRSAEEDYPTPMSTEQDLEPVRSKKERKSKKGDDDGGKSKRKSKKEKKDKP